MDDHTTSAAADMRRARAAEKQRRYRERRAAGLSVVPVEVGADVIAALVRQGRVELEDAADPARLALVLGEIVENFLSTGNGSAR